MRSPSIADAAPKDSPLRACGIRSCGRVADDVRVYDISSVAGTIRLALCRSCAAAARADEMTILELVATSECVA